MSAQNATATTTNPATETAADKRKATVESKRAKRIAERGYALPLVLTCTVTGKQVKYTSPTYIDKVISKFGSLEKLQKGYISREGRAQQKAEAAKNAPAKPAKTEKPAKAPKAPKAPKSAPAPAAAPATSS